MADAPTYHLWLKPSGRIYETLSRTIRTLAREFRAPVFDPHVTLAGPLEGNERELLDRCERLRNELAPFAIVLDEPLDGPDYFRCVFMRAVPDAAIMDANQSARRIFSLPERPFMPHLSLIYGTYSAEERARIVSDLPPDVRLSFTADSFDLILSKTSDPKDWYSVRSMPFLLRRD
jgi:2'-5' RNA ligase